MHIGAAAKASGLPVKTVRYYADTGLITPKRSSSGYRLYTQKQVQQLVFIRNARTMGFNLKECSKLLQLLNDPSRKSAEVKQISLEHLQKIERQIAGLQLLHSELSQLTRRCAGNQQSICPILQTIGKLDECQAARSA